MCAKLARIHHLPFTICAVCSAKHPLSNKTGYLEPVTLRKFDW